MINTLIANIYDLEKKALTMEKSFDDDRRNFIQKILEQIELLSESEKFILILKIPTSGKQKCTSNYGSDSIDGDCGNLDDSFRVTSAQTDNCPVSGSPGALGSALYLSNQVEQSQAYAWILSHLEEDPSTCLRKDEVFDDYRNYCDSLGMKYLNTADFGKVMKRAFPNVKPRRLGQRGQSKYCYGGMRKKIEAKPPSLPDISAKLGCLDQGLNLKNFNQSKSETHTQFSASSFISCNSTNDKNNNPTIGSTGLNNGQYSFGTQYLLQNPELLEHCTTLVLEWAEKLFGHHQCQGLLELANYLVSNMYVNSRSRAAFHLIAEFHNNKSLFSNNSTSQISNNNNNNSSVSGGGSVNGNHQLSSIFNNSILGQTVSASVAQLMAQRALNGVKSEPHTPNSPHSQVASPHQQQGMSPSTAVPYNPSLTNAHRVPPNPQMFSPTVINSSQSIPPQSDLRSPIPYTPSNVDLFPYSAAKYAGIVPPDSIPLLRSPYDDRARQISAYNTGNVENISVAPGAFDPSSFENTIKRARFEVNNSVNGHCLTMSNEKINSSEKGNINGSHVINNINSGNNNGLMNNNNNNSNQPNCAIVSSSLTEALFCTDYSTMPLLSPMPAQSSIDEVMSSGVSSSNNGLRISSDSSFSAFTSTSTSTPRNSIKMDDKNSTSSLVNRSNKLLADSSSTINSSQNNNSDSSTDSTATVKYYSRDELHTPGPNPYDQDIGSVDVVMLPDTTTELPRIGLSPPPRELTTK